MTRRIINVGTGPNTKDGDTVRLAFQKVNDNFSEVYDTLDVLAGGTAELIQTSIKGSVYDNNGNLLIDASTGKITTNSVPANVPLMYQFVVTFFANGNLDSVIDIPDGWSYVKNANILTVTHNTQRVPKVISYWGRTNAGNYQLRYPTGGYQATRPEAIPSEFTVHLIAAVAGADNSQSAIVTVLF